MRDAGMTLLGKQAPLPVDFAQVPVVRGSETGVEKFPVFCASVGTRPVADDPETSRRLSQLNRKKVRSLPL